MRRRGPSWPGFLRARATGILDADFFILYSVFFRQVYVLFVIEVKARRVSRVSLLAITARATTSQNYLIKYLCRLPLPQRSSALLARTLYS